MSAVAGLWYMNEKSAVHECTYIYIIYIYIYYSCRGAMSIYSTSAHVYFSGCGLNFCI